MGLLKRRTVLTGLSSLLVASSALFADAIVDAEFDNNENEFENYWYYFDDNAGVGADDRPTAGAGTQQSVINVETTQKAREAFAGDILQVNDYKFTPGSDLAGKFASMPYTMGSNWTTSWGEAQPYVGLGTMLAADGESIDLTGATAITFKIKSRVSPLTVRFKVQTLQIDQYSEVQKPPKGAFAYYEKAIEGVSKEQSSVTVLIPGDLTLPLWAVGVNNHKIPFDITKVTKLAWEVKKEDNENTTTDTLDVDDVVIVGYNYVSKTVHQGEASMDLPATGKYSDFEGEFPDGSDLGYWYAYNDAAIGGTSSVSAGATVNPATKLLKFDWTDGSGSDDAGKGPLLRFTLGPTVKQGENDVQGFVGIGVNVYDSSESVYWDAKTAGASSIYFHYLLDGDVKWASLEISDENDVADAQNPTRKDGRGSGVVWYKNLLPTGGNWKAVEIKFSDLVYHSNWQGSKNIPLDLSKLAKFQWKVQGAEGKEGAIQIDNVYFPGVSKFEFPNSAVIKNMRFARNSGFNAAYANGNILINWTSKTRVTDGVFSLVNTQGAVIATAPAAKANDLTINMSASKLPAGMYFVRMNGVDVNGKTIATQAPVTIVK